MLPWMLIKLFSIKVSCKTKDDCTETWMVQNWNWNHPSKKTVPRWYCDKEEDVCKECKRKLFSSKIISKDLVLNGNLLESFNWFLILCIKDPKPKPLPKCDCRFDEALNSRQSSEGVDWCWLMESPCILLNNEVTSSKATWVDCEKDGQEQINCGGKKTVTKYISYHLSHMIL